MMPALATLRAGAARMRRLVNRERERALRPLRHARALDRLRGMPRPRSILVVCHGNICRSPFLEMLLRRLLPDTGVRSAGLIGPGRQPPSLALAAAERFGVFMGAHRSQLLSDDLVRASDLAIVMEERQARALRRYGMSADRVIVAGDLDPEPGAPRTVADPWGGGHAEFDAAYARLHRIAALTAAALTD